MSATTIPVDYEERVYAGVLGKVIAVYLGSRTHHDCPISQCRYRVFAEVCRNA